MPDLYRYSKSFEPVLLEDMTATLYGADIPAEGLNVKCLAVGALPERYVNFGALTAATWDTDNEDTGLELNPWELGQYRMRILDDMVCRLKNPAPVAQWRTLRQNFYLPKFPTEGTTFLQEYYWMASEFFVWEDTTPRFDFYSVPALATAEVLFSGWRFRVQKIATPGKIRIWVSEWPTSIPPR